MALRGVCCRCQLRGAGSCWWGTSAAACGGCRRCCRGDEVWLLLGPSDGARTRSRCFRSAGTEWGREFGCCRSRGTTCGRDLAAFVQRGRSGTSGTACGGGRVIVCRWYCRSGSTCCLSRTIFCAWPAEGRKKCCYQVVRDKKDGFLATTRGQAIYYGVTWASGEWSVVPSTYVLLH